MFKNYRNLYPTHKNRVGRYFGELSIQPALKGDQQIYDRIEPQLYVTIHSKVSISDLLNSMIVLLMILGTS